MSFAASNRGGSTIRSSSSTSSYYDDEVNVKTLFDHFRAGAVVWRDDCGRPGSFVRVVKNNDTPKMPTDVHPRSKSQSSFSRSSSSSNGSFALPPQRSSSIFSTPFDISALSNSVNLSSSFSKSSIPPSILQQYQVADATPTPSESLNQTVTSTSSVAAPLTKTPTAGSSAAYSGVVKAQEYKGRTPSSSISGVPHQLSTNNTTHRSLSIQSSASPPSLLSSVVVQQPSSTSSSSPSPPSMPPPVFPFPPAADSKHTTGKKEEARGIHSSEIERKIKTLSSRPKTAAAKAPPIKKSAKNAAAAEASGLRPTALGTAESFCNRSKKRSSSAGVVLQNPLNFSSAAATTATLRQQAVKQQQQHDDAAGRTPVKSARNRWRFACLSRSTGGNANAKPKCFDDDDDTDSEDHHGSATLPLPPHNPLVLEEDRGQKTIFGYKSSDLLATCGSPVTNHRKMKGQQDEDLRGSSSFRARTPVPAELLHPPEKEKKVATNDVLFSSSSASSPSSSATTKMSQRAKGAFAYPTIAASVGRNTEEEEEKEQCIEGTKGGQGRAAAWYNLGVVGDLTVKTDKVRAQDEAVAKRRSALAASCDRMPIPPGLTFDNFIAKYSSAGSYPPPAALSSSLSKSSPNNLSITLTAKDEQQQTFEEVYKRIQKRNASIANGNATSRNNMSLSPERTPDHALHAASSARDLLTQSKRLAAEQAQAQLGDHLKQNRLMNKQNRLLDIGRRVHFNFEEDDSSHTPAETTPPESPVIEAVSEMEAFLSAPRKGNAASVAATKFVAQVNKRIDSRRSRSGSGTP